MSGNGVGWRPLSEAVTELAFDGHPDAPTEALRKLCEGEWMAYGKWTWWAWAGAIFQSERTDTIPTERWRGLEAARNRGLDGWKDGRPLPTFANGYSFKSELPHWETAKWDWATNSFTTALLIEPEREECFCAFDIDVWPVQKTEHPPVPPSAPSNEGGRPPKWDWEAAALAMAGRHFVDVWKPATVAEVVRALQDWASDNGQDLPDATAKPHAKRIFEAIQRWEKAP